MTVDKPPAVAAQAMAILSVVFPAPPFWAMIETTFMQV